MRPRMSDAAWHAGLAIAPALPVFAILVANPDQHLPSGCVGLRGGQSTVHDFLQLRRSQMDTSRSWSRALGGFLAQAGEVLVVGAQLGVAVTVGLPVQATRLLLVAADPLHRPHDGEHQAEEEAAAELEAGSLAPRLAR